MKKFFIFYILGFGAMAIIAGCNGEGSDNVIGRPKVSDSAEIKNEPPAFQTALDLAGLRGADSVQILFFKDPYEKDSLRYTRFFTYYNSSDTAFVKPFLRNLDQLFSFRTDVLNCKSEGKLFFFKGGQELKTVYFNTGVKVQAIKGKLPKEDICAFLYFIKDGGFYYLPIDSETIALLKSLKPKAVEPAAAIN